MTSLLPPLKHIVETTTDGIVVERYRVKTVGRWHIEVIPMLWNWRVHTVAVNGGPRAWSERYWCYAGRGEETFVAAVLAAHAWDGAHDTEPVGWVKSWDQRVGATDSAWPQSGTM